MRTASFTLVVTLCALGTLRTPAHANGRPSNSTGVFAKPGDPNKIMLGLTFGMAFTQDAGKTWYWACEDVLGGTNSVDNMPLWMQNDTLVVGMQRGVYVSGDMGCTWTSVGTYSSVNVVSAVTLHPTDANALIIASYTVSDPNKVSTVVSTSDLGQTFSTVYASSGTSQPSVSSVAIPPTNPNRIYLAGWVRSGTGGVQVLRSDDAGANWTTFTAPVSFNPTYALTPVVAVSPTDPNVFLLGAEDSSAATTDIIRSSDGGQTMNRILTVPQQFRSFAFSSDGTVAIAAGTRSTYRSTDAGQTFAPLPKPAANACIGYANEQFYSCGGAYTGDANNPNSATAVDCYALASSANNGNTWLPIINLADIKGPANCAADSNETTSCLSQWPNQQAADATYILGPWTGLCQSPNVLDPNHPTEPTTDIQPDAPKKGCNCTEAPLGASDTLLAVMGCGAVLLRRRRPRRHAR